MNVAHMRLQYEILNRPLKHLALENNVPLEMLRDEAADHGWKQWWPEPDLIVIPDVDKDELLIVQSEAYLERTKRRLAVYNVSKEILLAQKYYELENKILDAALHILDLADTLEPSSIQALGMLYKNLMSRSVSGAVVDMSFGVDDGGLPTVIVKDLSGTKRVIDSNTIAAPVASVHSAHSTHSAHSAHSTQSEK